MSEAIKREIHGLLPTGEWVFFGRADMSDDEVRVMTCAVGEQFSKEHFSGKFSVGSSVFKAASFVGLRITPPAPEATE